MAEINLQKRVVYAGDVHIALLKSGWSIREACDFVNGLPKADVAEVRRGEWVFKRRYYDADECNCSECGQLMTTHSGKRMNYCPLCGCKMDLGGADNGERNL